MSKILYHRIDEAHDLVLSDSSSCFCPSSQPPETETFGLPAARANPVGLFRPKSVQSLPSTEAKADPAPFTGPAVMNEEPLNAKKRTRQAGRLRTLFFRASGAAFPVSPINGDRGRFKALRLGDGALRPSDARARKGMNSLWATARGRGSPRRLA